MKRPLSVADHKPVIINLRTWHQLRIFCHRYQAMINCFAVLLMFVTFWFHDFQSQNINDLKNQLSRAQYLFAVQQSIFNLDQYLSQSHRASYLNNSTIHSLRKQPDYQNIRNKLLGMKLLIDQLWYMQKALTDNNPDLPFASRKLARTATSRVLAADQQDLNVISARFQHLLDFRVDPNSSTPTKEQQYIAAIHKQESSLGLTYFRAQWALSIAEPEILMAMDHMINRVETQYQFYTDISYAFWFIGAIFTLIVNLPAPKTHENNGEP